MSANTHISLVQLIKSGELKVNIEVERIQAKGDVNVYVRQYLNNSPDYADIIAQQERVRERLQQAADEAEKTAITQQLQHLEEVAQDFQVNALLLGKLFAEIEIRSERLQEALALFEAGRIKAADEVLAGSDLLNDQFNLFVYVDYREAKLNSLLHDS